MRLQGCVTVPGLEIVPDKPYQLPETSTGRLSETTLDKKSAIPEKLNEVCGESQRG